MIELIFIAVAIIMESFCFTYSNLGEAQEVVKKQKSFIKIFFLLIAVAYMIYTIVWLFDEDIRVHTAGLGLLILSCQTFILRRIGLTHPLLQEIDALLSSGCLGIVGLARIGGLLGRW